MFSVFMLSAFFFIRSVLLIFVPGIKFSPICVHNNCLCLRLKQKGLGKTFCTVLCELVHPWQSITSCPGGGVVVPCFMWLAYDTPLSSEELPGKGPE